VSDIGTSTTVEVDAAPHMTRLGLALAAALCLIAPLTHAVGVKFTQIPGGGDGPAIDAAVWSPCSAAPAEMKIEGLTVPAAPNCPIAGEKLPLIVISHGYGILAIMILPKRLLMLDLLSSPSTIRKQITRT
jgi:hypothetical protein